MTAETDAHPEFWVGLPDHEVVYNVFHLGWMFYPQCGKMLFKKLPTGYRLILNQSHEKSTSTSTFMLYMMKSGGPSVK